MSQIHVMDYDFGWIASLLSLVILYVIIKHYSKRTETLVDAQSKHDYRGEVGEAMAVLVSDHLNRTIFLSLKFTFSLMSTYFLQ